MKLSDYSLEELWELFPIIVTEHNPAWKEWFCAEESSLRKILPNAIVRLSHIGSTAVDALPAKPTIDILLEIPQEYDIETLKILLTQNGYLYSAQPNNPAPHMMFLRGYTEHGFADKVYHLHIRYPGNWGELYFRDYLQLHPDVAAEYGKLKKHLQKQYTHDRDGYTAAKTNFIEKYTTKAKKDFSNKYTPIDENKE